MPPRVVSPVREVTLDRSDVVAAAPSVVRVFGEGRFGFLTESGSILGPVDVAFETWGRLDPDGGNAVLVLHALTGDSHAAGPAGGVHSAPGWWDGLIGPGLAIDTDRFFVVCPNVLGGCRGTTGPSSLANDGEPYGSRFPEITVRDLVGLEHRFAEVLGIKKWAAVIGGSMGGMRALEWAITYPDQVERAVVLAVGAAASAEQIALCSLQVRAIRSDPHFLGGDYYGHDQGPWEGMALARGIGQLSYRTAQEMEARFGRTPQAGDSTTAGARFAVESYLEHHGAKLASRFDANSYVLLSELMNWHDVGRNRGGLAAALGRVTAKTTVVGIDSDRLYPLSQQYELAGLLPGDHEVRVVKSDVGHDGFLVETDQVGTFISEALAS